MMRGKKNVLTAYPISFYAHTSGTLGAPKHIPYTEKAEEIVRRYASIAGEAYAETLSGKQPQMPSEPKTLYITTGREDHAPDGTLITNFSGKFLLEYRDVLKQTAVQPELIFCDAEMDRMYLFAFYALREKNLICIMLFIETDPEIEHEKKQEMRDFLDERLSEASVYYAHYRQEKKLELLELILLQPQTFALYRDVQVWNGASPNQLKPIHVITNPKTEAFFRGLKTSA